MLSYLPQSVSWMFPNNVIFASDGVAILSHLLTHLNPSSRQNLFLAISDLTCLDMGIGESIIDYMSRVRGISQCMQGITMDRIIPLFAITSLDRHRYPGLKSRYLVGDVALVNCNLLEFSGLLSSEETQLFQS